MEIILPAPLTLKPIIGSDASGYETWQSGTYYPAGIFVYDDVDGHNYEAVANSTDKRPSSHSELWKDLGASPGNITGFVSSAPNSEYRVWKDLNDPDGEFVLGERCFFPDSRREYEALKDFFNFGSDPCKLLFLVRVSECWRTDPATGDCLCYTPNMVQYFSNYDTNGRLRGPQQFWADLGVMNPLRALDEKDVRRTVGTSPLTMTIQATGTCDRIGFFDLVDVASIAVAGDVNIPTTSLEIGNSGIYRSSIMLSHPPVANPEYELTFTGPLSTGTIYYTNWLARNPQVGNIVAGQAFDCGPTEINLQNRIVTARLTEDDYGNVSRPEQWYAKRITGIVRPPARTADQVISLLSRDLDRPVLVDFSDGQLAESGPLVYGYVEQATHTITGLNDADGIEVIIRGFSQ